MKRQKQHIRWFLDGDEIWDIVIISTAVGVAWLIFEGATAYLI